MIRRALAVLGIGLAATALVAVAAVPSSDYAGKHRTSAAAPVFESGFDAGVWRMHTRSRP